MGALGEGVFAWGFRGLKALNYARKAKKLMDAASASSVSDKLIRYLLNFSHKTGASKAKWFKEALGFTTDNMDDLAKQIVFNPAKAVQTAITEHGVKYNQVISVLGANGKKIDVVFAWIKGNDGIVKLVTAIPTKL
jgi:predicted DNA-binding protein